MVIRSESNTCRLPPGPRPGRAGRGSARTPLGQSSSVPSSSPIRCRVSVTRASGRQRNRGMRWASWCARIRCSGHARQDLTPWRCGSPRAGRVRAMRRLLPAFSPTAPQVRAARTAGLRHTSPAAAAAPGTGSITSKMVPGPRGGDNGGRGETGGAGMALEVKRLHLASLRGRGRPGSWPVHGFVVTHPGGAVLVDTGVGGPQERAGRLAGGQPLGRRRAGRAGHDARPTSSW